MKTYKKSKFWFINNGTKTEPKNGDIYFRYEWKLKSKFPFIFKPIIGYTLINDIWVEQTFLYNTTPIGCFLDVPRNRGFILFPPLFFIVLFSLIHISSIFFEFDIHQAFFDIGLFFTYYLMIGLFIILMHDYKKTMKINEKRNRKK